MRVLQINSCCGCYSTGRIVSDIARQLMREGHQCRVEYGTDYLDTGIDAKRIKSFRKLNALLARMGDGAGYGAWIATKRLVGSIIGYDPDIIHLHNLHGDYVNIRILFGFLAAYNKPILWTMHDCWPITGHCAHFTEAACMRWKTGCYDCPLSSAYPKSYLFDRSSSNYRNKKRWFTAAGNLQIVAVSQWLAGVYKESFMKSYPIHVIGNGIDLDVFKPTESDLKIKHGIGNRKLVLGVAGSWSKKKGLDDFIEVAKRLNRDEYAAVIVGADEKQRRLIPEDTICIGLTTNDDELARIYSAADVFLNLSCQETFGMTTVEALACGTPVIVYNTTACPELVSDGCGAVADLGNISGVVSAIGRLTHETHPESCVRSVLRYEKQRQSEQYIRLYKSALGM